MTKLKSRRGPPPNPCSNSEIVDLQRMVVAWEISLVFFQKMQSAVILNYIPRLLLPISALSEEIKADLDQHASKYLPRVNGVTLSKQVLGPICIRVFIGGRVMPVNLPMSQ